MTLAADKNDGPAPPPLLTRSLLRLLETGCRSGRTLGHERGRGVTRKQLISY